MEKPTYFEKADSNLTAIDKKEEKIRLRKEKFPEEKLAKLLKNRMLKKDILINEALMNGYDVYLLGLLIISQSELQDAYINYKNSEQNKNSSDEEVLFSFFEKIQQPEEIEQKSQVPDVSATPVAPTTLPADEPQPDTVPSQVPEIPNLESSPVPEIIPSAQSAENINKPERKNWWEVKRETEVMAVEDLDGDMQKFEKHVKELGVAKKDANGNWQWTGDSKKLVFLGDILGDRNLDGVKITNTVFDLAN